MLLHRIKGDSFLERYSLDLGKNILAFVRISSKNWLMLWISSATVFIERKMSYHFGLKRLECDACVISLFRSKTFVCSQEWNFKLNDSISQTNIFIKEIGFRSNPTMSCEISRGSGAWGFMIHLRIFCVDFDEIIIDLRKLTRQFSCDIFHSWSK